MSNEETWKSRTFTVRQATRDLALQTRCWTSTSLFVKRAPTMFPHLSDQYYGWWARPGGGLYLLEGDEASSPRSAA